MKIPTITAYDRADFRKWLKKNHKKESKVTIILHKRHTGKDAPTHRELIEEAICFGWIDTTIRRIDDDTFLRNFTKRNKNSKWSDNTLGYARQLIKEGKMTEEGMKFYELGRAKPTHDHGIPKNPNMPRDLKSALVKSKKAEEHFKKFPPSERKMLYRWILSTKLPETRKKRIDRIVKKVQQSSRDIILNK
jgi:uncharacterized protein YdeI (YjbR/CyaY-like superfamily)